MSFTGKQTLASICQVLAQTGFGDISPRLVRSLFEYFGEPRQPRFLVAQVLVENIYHKFAIQGACFMHGPQVSVIFVAVEKDLEDRKILAAYERDFGLRKVLTVNSLQQTVMLIGAVEEQV